MARPCARADYGVVPSPKDAQGTASAHIEPAGNGYAIIEAARAQRFAPNEIAAKYDTASGQGTILFFAKGLFSRGPFIQPTG
jgi:hypothetical protein